MNLTKNLVEPKHYMNPTKNLIELKPFVFESVDEPRNDIPVQPLQIRFCVSYISFPSL